MQQLLDEAELLRKDVRAAERARRRENRIGFAVLGVLTIFIALLVAISWQNNQIVKQTQATNDTIVDCTTPGGACYRQSQARTAAVVADLIKASTFVSQCARLRPGESGPAFDRFLERCVAEKLANDPAPSPSPTAPRAPAATPSGGA